MEKSNIRTAAVILGILAVILTAVIISYMPDTPEIPKCPNCVCPELEPLVISEGYPVEVEVAPNYKQKVVDALTEEIGKDKELRTCDDDRYKASEIKVKKLYYGFVLEENGDGDTAISEVKIKLNYDEGKCYRTLTCGLDVENELTCE